MDLLAVVFAILIGLSLGLLGSGGSIFTVPMLIYVVGIHPEQAISYSLFIVAVTTLIGAIDYFYNGRIQLQATLGIALPSVISVLLTRRFLLQALPNAIVFLGNTMVHKRTYLMVLFALLMLAASLAMIKPVTKVNPDKTPSFSYLILIVLGIIVGILTGLVGSGGGFIIIPAMVILGNFSLKSAVGSSLIVICANSTIGFFTDITTGAVMDWPLIISFTIFAIIGVMAGSRLSKTIDGNKLRPGFGWLILALGILILVKESIY